MQYLIAAHVKGHFRLQLKYLLKYCIAIQKFVPAM